MPKVKIAQVPMYHKNSNAAKYDPVGGLRKLIKKQRNM